MLKAALQSVYRRSNYLTSQIACYCECVQEVRPGVQVSTLGNGVRVATEETGSPLACVSLFIEAGPRFETACTNGISHFIEHLAYKGFKNLKKTDLEYLLLQTGAKATAETHREMQIFSVQGPADCAGCFVDILSTIVTDPELDPCEIELEHHNLRLEMADTDKDPKSVLFDYLHAAAFQGTPLGQRVIGPSHNVCRFDKCTTLSFLRDQYQPYKFVLAISGNVMHEQMVCFADARLGCLPCDPSFASEDGPCRFTGSEVIYRDDSMPLAHVAIGFEAPGYGGDEYLTMLVMSHMLGSWHASQPGGECNANPIARAVAAHGLCQSFQSFYIPYRGVGLWGVYFVGDRMHLDVMVGCIQDQWMKFCTMTRQADVTRGLTSARLEVAKRYEGAVNSSYDIGTQMMYVGERRPYEHLNERLCAVKIHSIKSAAEHYLYDRCPAVAAVGPTEALPEYNRIRSLPAKDTRAVTAVGSGESVDQVGMLNAKIWFVSDK